MNSISSDSLFKKTEAHYTKQLPFVIFRKPLSENLNSMLCNKKQLEYLVDFNDSGFLFAPFDLDKDIVFFNDNCSLKYTSSDFSAASIFQENIQELDVNFSQKEAYKKLVSTAIDSIKSKKLKKVVVSRCTEISLKNRNCFNIFKDLLSKYNRAFVYLWFHPEVGLWLGATPEKLIEIKGKTFNTVALAGTKSGSSENIEWQNKEYEEQNLVTNYLKESLKDFSSNLSVSKLETIKAGSLHHLRTKIYGRLNSERVNLKEFIYKLHPTPAVCGLPKEAAKNFILKNENYDREFYTGFLGEINNVQVNSRKSIKHNTEHKAYFKEELFTDLFVNLRCFQIKNEMAKIYIGGGITKDSIPENEWEETVEKSRTIKTVL